MTRQKCKKPWNAFILNSANTPMTEPSAFLGSLHGVGVVHCAASTKSTVDNNFCKSCMVGGQICSFLALSSLAVFFVYHPWSACNVKRAFSSTEYILTHDCLHLNTDAARHLAIMYVDKMAMKQKHAEKKEDQ